VIVAANPGLGFYLQQPFAQHALLAAGIVAVTCGLIGPFVVARGMAFAVHGTSELAFTGAAVAILFGQGPIAGALVGTSLFAGIIGLLGVRQGDRDSAIGVILAFGLGMGVLALSYNTGYASEATNILFGDILGVSNSQLVVLGVIGGVVALALCVLYRPLLFASVDPDVAASRGVPVRALGIVFLFLLAWAVTVASQVVGALLVLSLAITPAAAAQRLSASPTVVTLLSVAFAVVAADGGLMLSFESSRPSSVFITSASFAIYVVARLVGPRLRGSRRNLAVDGD
jgi:zinc/manganese transport system permease protein